MQVLCCITVLTFLVCSDHVLHAVAVGSHNLVMYFICVHKCSYICVRNFPFCARRIVTKLVSKAK